MFINAARDNVTWFSSEQVGSPQILGQSNGDMLKVLDACLVDGFNTKAATSVVINNGIITLSFGISHGYLEGQLIDITGADDAAINGRHRIKSITPTTLIISVVGALIATGAISVRVAPLGWESIFGKIDPLRRAFRSNAPTDGNRVLYLDMSYDGATGYHASSPATRAVVRVCGDMTTLGVQIDPMTNNLNTTSDGTLFWYQKRTSSKATAIPNTVTKWKVIGNENFFYFMVAWGSYNILDATNYASNYGFGRFEGTTNGATDNTFLRAENSPRDVDISASVGIVSGQTNSPLYIFSAGGEIELARIATHYTTLTGDTTIPTSGVSDVPYPSEYGNMLFASAFRVYKGVNVMGVLPSMVFIENNILGTRDGEIVGGVLLASSQAYKTSNSRPATLGFYIGG